MIKRIIFDIDGTLITGQNFKEYVERALKRYGIDDLEKVKTFLSSIKDYEKEYTSYDRRTYLDFFSARLSTKLDYRFLRIFFDELKDAVPKDTTRIKAMLDSLKDYELALLSNYFEESQRNRLQAMGINDYFISYAGEKTIKPYNDAYIMSAGGNNPSECLIVGDDKYLDVDKPRSLGFKALYVHEDGDIKKVEEITPLLVKSIK